MHSVASYCTGFTNLLKKSLVSQTEPDRPRLPRRAHAQNRFVFVTCLTRVTLKKIPNVPVLQFKKKRKLQVYDL